MKQNKGFFNKSIHNCLSQDTTKSKTLSNLTPNPSHKKLKIFAGTSLALFMGISTLCGVAFAPTTTPNLATSSTSPASTPQPQSTGLITPQKDDPVLFTTENGLEIKWGNSNSIHNIPILSGYPNNNEGLRGFPYFSTFDDDGQYDWVIIGQSSLFPVFDVGKNDPAGIIIQQECFHKIEATEEIPANSVLCLANNIVASGSGSSGATISILGGSKWYCCSDYRSPLLTTMDDYYINNNWGIELIKEHIVAVSLTTTGTAYYDTGSTYSNPGSSTTAVTLENKFIYPLASSTYENNSFRYNTYLTTSEILLPDTQWLRDGSGENKYVFNTSIQTTLKGNNSAGFRPAFCLKVV